jgi:SET domain-containing protein
MQSRKGSQASSPGTSSVQASARRSRAGDLPGINPRYACFRLRAARSAIHGRGVFACEPIPAGRKVIEYAGERISRAENRRRFVRAWQRGGNRRIYLARLDSYWSIDGSRGGSGAEFINHCCDPNVLMRRVRGRLFYFSRRKIRRGEELTLDYAFRKDGPRVPCRCGAPACRGTINRQ